MIILDTNLVSEMMRAAPNSAVNHWIDQHMPVDFACSTITLFEIRYGLNLLPISAKRHSLEATLPRIMNSGAFGRILAFGQTTADCAAEIFATRRRLGRPIQISDCLIAGHVLEHKAVLGTRNVRDFDGVGLSLINPWEIAT